MRKKTHYSHYYTPTTRDMVYSFWKNDIMTFGYTYDAGCDYFRALPELPSAIPVTLAQVSSWMCALTRIHAYFFQKRTYFMHHVRRIRRYFDSWMFYRGMDNPMHKNIVRQQSPSKVLGVVKSHITHYDFGHCLLVAWEDQPQNVNHLHSVKYFSENGYSFA